MEKRTKTKQKNRETITLSFPGSKFASFVTTYGSDFSVERTNLPPLMCQNNKGKQKHTFGYTETKPNSHFA